MTKANKKTSQKQAGGARQHATSVAHTSGTSVEASMYSGTVDGVTILQQSAKEKARADSNEPPDVRGLLLVYVDLSQHGENSAAGAASAWASSHCERSSDPGLSSSAPACLFFH